MQPRAKSACVSIIATLACVMSVALASPANAQPEKSAQPEAPSEKPAESAAESQGSPAEPEESPPEPEESTPEPEEPSAEPSAEPEELSIGPENKPWHRGVSADDQRIARQLFQEGVVEHKALRWMRAVERYQTALERWPEHPELHLVLARAYRNLGRHVEAYTHLERALRWGADGLSSSYHKMAIELRDQLLRDHVAVIEITCNEPGALVSLDGEPWFKGPGTQRKAVRPGRHEFLAEKASKFPVRESTTLLASQQAAITLDMETDRGVLTQRRWSAWKPWTTLGAGLAAGLTGGVLLDLSRRNYGRYDEDLKEVEDAADGFAPGTIPDNISDIRVKANWQQGIAFGLFAASGVAIAIGSYMVLRNQPREVRDEPTQRNRWQLVPIVHSDGGGLSMALSF